MNQPDDRVFIRRFSGVILGLVGVTVAIIVLAVSLRSEPDYAANPSQKRFIEERIAPVATVRTGEPGEAIAARPEEIAPTPPETGVSGEETYNTVCTACHAAGVAGAPIPGSEALAQRLADKGVEGLVSSVINGLNAMPPKGGRPDVTDEQIRAAVDYMLN